VLRCTTLQALPLLGGRNASAHAAAIIEQLCTPPPPSAQAAAAGSAGKDGAKGGKSRAASASSKASSRGAAGGDKALAAALQQGVLAAGGLPALLKVWQGAQKFSGFLPDAQQMLGLICVHARGSPLLTPGQLTVFCFCIQPHSVAACFPENPALAEPSMTSHVPHGMYCCRHRCVPHTAVQQPVVARL
jgi:hypothetical protein